MTVGRSDGRRCNREQFNRFKTVSMKPPDVLTRLCGDKIKYFKLKPDIFSLYPSGF